MPCMFVAFRQYVRPQPYVYLTLLTTPSAEARIVLTNLSIAGDSYLAQASTP